MKQEKVMQILTKRCVFRNWKLEDADAVADGLNDFDVAKNLTVPFPYTKENAIDFIEKHLENDEKNYYFAIVNAEDGRLVGGTNIFINEAGEFHGGIWLHRDFQGKGYGTEIWTARAKFAFDFLGAEELMNGFYDFNERSKKMQQKIGHKIVGEKTNYSPALKSEVREVLTKLSKADFEKYYNSIDFAFSVEDEK